MQTLVIIPTYDEKENIEALLTQILEQKPDIHVLVVDDNSPDHTSDLVEAFGRTHALEQVHLLKRSGKMGLGTAYIEGFRWALEHGFDYIIQMDADFSHKPVYIADFISTMQDYDLVLGSRYIPGGAIKGWGFLRNFISRGGNYYARAVLGLPYHDLTGGYKCFRRSVLESINLNEIHAKGYAFQIEMTYRAHCKKFRIGEIPIVFEDRIRGKSQFSGSIFLEAITIVWKLRRKIRE